MQRNQKTVSVARKEERVCTLLVGMWTGTDCTEINLEDFLKSRHRTITSKNQLHIPKGLYILLQRYLFIQLTAALFTVAKKCNRPRCPWTEKCVRKMWYTDPKKFCSVVNKNDIRKFESKWIKQKKNYTKQPRHRNINPVCCLSHVNPSFKFLNLHCLTWSICRNQETIKGAIGVENDHKWGGNNRT